MYSIGDLSQLAGVTPRMLRHYHDLGILIPADVDAITGYRRYDESQLADLLQLLALKGLGFALTDIKRVTDGGISPQELRGMLLLRRTELESELDEASTRLQRVEAHIHRLENQMNASRTNHVTVTTKRLPAVHLAVASGVSASFASADIGPVIQPLYPQLFDAFERGRSRDCRTIHCVLRRHRRRRDRRPRRIPDRRIRDQDSRARHRRPARDRARSHRNPPRRHGDRGCRNGRTDLRLDATHGFRTTGYSREHYLECPDDLTQWRTEMQFPIEPDADS